METKYGALNRRQASAYRNVATVVRLLLQPGGATQSELQNSLTDSQGQPISTQATVLGILGALEEAGLTVIGRGPSGGQGVQPPLTLAIPHGAARQTLIDVAFGPEHDVLALCDALAAPRYVALYASRPGFATFLLSGGLAEQELFLGFAGGLGLHAVVRNES